MPAKSKKADVVERTQEIAAWWQTEDATADGIADWDVKTHILGEAILKVISTGTAIRLGKTRDGGAVAITLWAGEAKKSIYLHDSVEFDDWAFDTVGRASRALERQKPGS